MSLSKLNSEVFTIINQIPVSATAATKAAWHKFRLVGCDKKEGICDKTSGTMLYKANSWTAYIKDWKHYRKPTFTDGGYYALSDGVKDRYYTANSGDLLIFADISDPVPKNLAEFNEMVKKYKGISGVITGVSEYIHFKPNGEPWKTNHIELIRE